MNGQDGRAQGEGAVGADQLKPVGLLAAEIVQRLIEGAIGQALGVQTVQDPKARIQPRAQGVRAQQPGAEAVNRGDERTLGGPGRVERPQLAQPEADALAHLGRRLLGEGDRKQRGNLEPVLQDRLHEALNQHGCLAAAGGRVQKQIPLAALDGPPLLVGPEAFRDVRDGAHPLGYLSLRQMPG